MIIETENTSYFPINSINQLAGVATRLEIEFINSKNKEIENLVETLFKAARYWADDVRIRFFHKQEKGCSDAVCTSLSVALKQAKSLESTLGSLVEDIFIAEKNSKEYFKNPQPYIDNLNKNRNVAVVGLSTLIGGE